MQGRQKTGWSTRLARVHRRASTAERRGHAFVRRPENGDDAERRAPPPGASPRSRSTRTPSIARQAREQPEVGAADQIDAPGRPAAAMILSHDPRRDRPPRRRARTSPALARQPDDQLAPRATAASASRDRTRLPAQSRRSARRPRPRIRPSSASARAAVSRPDATCAARFRRVKSKASHKLQVVRRLVHASPAVATPRASAATPPESAGKAPALGNARASCGQRGPKRVRQQQRGVELACAPATCASARGSGPRAAVRAAFVLFLEQRRDRRNRRDGQTCARHRPADGAHRRQRHHGVPSQFGARMTTATLEIWSMLRSRIARSCPAFFARRRREHPADLVVLRLDIPPAAVHPEPESGIAAHVHLEDVGAALRQLPDRVGIVGAAADPRRARTPCGTGRPAAAARTPARQARRFAARARPAPTSSRPAG